MGVRREIAGRPKTLELRPKSRKMRLGRLRDMNVRQR
jgi:hypothetical protein